MTDHEPYTPEAPYLLVGVAGEAGVGKTTVSDYLRGAHQFRCMEPADNLKSIATAMGWDGRKDDKGRAFLQTIGAAGRAYDPDTWVRMTDAQMQHEIIREGARNVAGMQYGLASRICVAGIRYENEARWLLERGGLLLYVTRPDSPDGLTGQAVMHESEVAARALGDWLAESNLPAFPGGWQPIHNDNSIVALRRVVGRILHTWNPDLFPVPCAPPLPPCPQCGAAIEPDRMWPDTHGVCSSCGALLSKAKA